MIHPKDREINKGATDMTREELKDYAMRICQGSKEDLVVTTFYIIDNYLEDARNAYKEGRMKDFVYALNKAKQFVNNLSSSLNYKYALAFELRNIYSFANKALVGAIVKKDASELEKIQSIFAKLRAGFEKVCEEQETKAPAFAGSQKVYVGLTYGKGTLNEYALRA
ncbi:MAG: hypothetical protein E7242_11160 [Lachnospiraceae bacterium]|nr:hypothetical protein [Lachnospiraceae bacterium]